MLICNPLIPFIFQHICHIIDFGLAKKFQDPRSGRHIPYLEVRIHFIIVERCPETFVGKKSDRDSALCFNKYTFRR